MIRLFVAIDLPPDVMELLAAISYGLAGAKWVEPDQLHLTLRFIGEVEGSRFMDIKEMLSTVEINQFPLRLKGIGHFPPRKAPRVLWVGIDKNEVLPRLRGKIETTLVKGGLPPEGRKYSPHITIARLKNTPAVTVGNFMAANTLFASEPFLVENFYLYSSN